MASPVAGVEARCKTRAWRSRRPAVCAGISQRNERVRMCAQRARGSTGPVRSSQWQLAFLDSQIFLTSPQDRSTQDHFLLPLSEERRPGAPPRWGLFSRASCLLLKAQPRVLPGCALKHARKYLALLNISFPLSFPTALQSTRS